MYINKIQAIILADALSQDVYKAYIANSIGGTDADKREIINEIHSLEKKLCSFSVDQRDGPNSVSDAHSRLRKHFNIQL